jgi:hypothetical protein
MKGCMMITDLRVVQDHGWVTDPRTGNMNWGPTNYFIEVLREGETEYEPLMIRYVNREPKVDEVMPLEGYPDDEGM